MSRVMTSVVLVALLAGCSGGSKKSADQTGSVPVKTIPLETTTATLRMGIAERRSASCSRITSSASGGLHKKIAGLLDKPTPIPTAEKSAAGEA